MSYYIFNKNDLKILIKAIQIHKKIESEIKKCLVAGSSPFEINQIVKSLCKKYKVKPAFFGEKNSNGDSFPEYSCVLVNSEIVHNIPTSKDIFKEGDLVKFDFGIIYQDFYTDFGFTKIIGSDVYKKRMFVNVVEMSVNMAKEKAVGGGRVGDISAVLQEIPLLYGYSPVHFFCGHGIGKSMHLDPQIPFWGEKNTGDVLIPGMVLCIENWISEKSNDIFFGVDGWTCTLKDGSFSAFYETMVLVKKNSFEDLREV